MPSCRYLPNNGGCSYGYDILLNDKVDGTEFEQNVPEPNRVRIRQPNHEVGCFDDRETDLYVWLQSQTTPRLPPTQCTLSPEDKDAIVHRYEVSLDPSQHVPARAQLLTAEEIDNQMGGVPELTENDYEEACVYAREYTPVTDQQRQLQRAIILTIRVRSMFHTFHYTWNRFVEQQPGRARSVSDHFFPPDDVKAISHMLRDFIYGMTYALAEEDDPLLGSFCDVYTHCFVTLVTWFFRLCEVDWGSWYSMTSGAYVNGFKDLIGLLQSILGTLAEVDVCEVNMNDADDYKNMALRRFVSRWA